MGLLNQLVKRQKPERNELCPCDSKLKFKNCHGDEALRQKCNQVGQHAARQAMLEYIAAKQIAAGICPRCKSKMKKRKCTNDECKMHVMTKKEIEKAAAKQIVVPNKEIIIPD